MQLLHFVISCMINLPNPKELPGCFISVLIWHNFFDKGHFIQLIYRGDTTALKNVRPLHSAMHTANMSNKPKNKYRFTAKVNQSSLGWGNAYPEITPPSMLGENLPGCMLQPCRRHHKKVSVLRPLQDRPSTEPSCTHMNNLHRR